MKHLEIFADSSFIQEKAIGTYAFRVRSDGFFHQESGFIQPWVYDPNVAELWAAVAAISEGLRHEPSEITLWTDNQTVVRFLRRTQAGDTDIVKTMLDVLFEELEDIHLDVFWIKSNGPEAHPDLYWCDRKAFELIQSYRPRNQPENPAFDIKRSNFLRFKIRECLDTIKDGSLLEALVLMDSLVALPKNFDPNNLILLEDRYKFLMENEKDRYLEIIKPYTR